VTWLAEEVGRPPRVAYAVGRPVGTAVARNRLRRRLRAVVAELAPAVAPGAWLISAGPAAADLTYEELKASVAEALSALTNEPAR
jgi:ribonuclease P protein component